MDYEGFISLGIKQAHKRNSSTQKTLKRMF